MAWVTIATSTVLGSNARLYRYTDYYLGYHNGTYDVYFGEGRGNLAQIQIKEQQYRTYLGNGTPIRISCTINAPGISNVTYTKIFSNSLSAEQLLVLTTKYGENGDITSAILKLEVDVPNAAPTTPSSISVPTTVNGGSSLSISWGASTDPDGNLAGYRLQRSVNGGTWTQIYQGGSRSYSDSITKGWGTVAYRVLAYDSDGATSGYTTSPTRTVINNTAPTVPSSITAPELRSGKPATISWSASTDSDGDTINYYLERSFNGGGYTVIRSGGTSTSYSDTPQANWSTVTYRVRAYDGTVYSGYRTSTATTVKHFPEFHMRVSGALKASDSGWVRINGALREIESITVRINGVLREV